MSLRSILYLCLLCVIFVLAWFLLTPPEPPPLQDDSHVPPSAHSVSSQEDSSVQSKPTPNIRTHKASSNTGRGNGIASLDNTGSATSHTDEATSPPPLIKFPDGTPVPVQPRELTIDEEAELLTLMLEYHDKDPSIVGISTTPSGKVFPMYNGGTMYVKRTEITDENGNLVLKGKSQFGNADYPDDGPIPPGTRVFELDSDDNIIAEYIQSDNPWDYIISRGLDPLIYYGYNLPPDIDGQPYPWETDYSSADAIESTEVGIPNNDLSLNADKRFNQMTDSLPSEINAPPHSPPKKQDLLRRFLGFLSGDEPSPPIEDLDPETQWRKQRLPKTLKAGKITARDSKNAELQQLESDLATEREKLRLAREAEKAERGGGNND